MFIYKEYYTKIKIENKFYLKLTIGDYFCAIDKGDSEEKAKENLSEKGMNYLEEIEFRGPAWSDWAIVSLFLLDFNFYYF